MGGGSTLNTLARYPENRVGARFLRLFALLAAAAVLTLGLGSARAAHSTSVTPTIYFQYSMDCTFFDRRMTLATFVTSIAWWGTAPQDDVTTPLAPGTYP